MPVTNWTKMRQVFLNSLYFLAFMLLLNVPNALGWRSFKIVFTRVEFEANSKLMDVKIQLKNDSETAVNVDINTLEVLEDVDVFASISLETDPGNYTVLMSRSLNFCKMLKERNSEPLARMIYQDMLRYGKFFKECPIQKGSYTLQEYRVDEEMLPSYLPETNFKFIMRTSKPKGDRIFKGIFYGKVDKSKGFNNLKMFSMG